MILSDLGPVSAYRMHTPRWATSPTSGAGAAANGGRANRPGTPALYLALEPETALREYQQLSPLMPPGTLVSYTVRLAPVIDFRTGYAAARRPLAGALGGVLLRLARAVVQPACRTAELGAG
jgi:RES domain-containing protein